MNISEIIKLYTSAIADAAKQGVDSVSISELERVNAEIVRIAAASPEDTAVGEAAIERYKAELVANIEKYRNEGAVNLEMLRGTLSTGQSALKSSLLINGGAAIAVLAFLGNAWSKGFPKHILENASYGLSLFVWGVLTAATASGFTFVSQAGYGDEFGKHSQRFGFFGRIVAVSLVAASYILFACAAWKTYSSLSST